MSKDISRAGNAGESRRPPATQAPRSGQGRILIPTVMAFDPLLARPGGLCPPGPPTKGTALRTRFGSVKRRACNHRGFSIPRPALLFTDPDPFPKAVPLVGVQGAKPPGLTCHGSKPMTAGISRKAAPTSLARRRTMIREPSRRRPSSNPPPRNPSTPQRRDARSWTAGWYPPDAIHSGP